MDIEHVEMHFLFERVLIGVFFSRSQGIPRARESHNSYVVAFRGNRASRYGKHNTYAIFHWIFVISWRYKCSHDITDRGMLFCAKKTSGIMIWYLYSICSFHYYTRICTYILRCAISNWLFFAYRWTDSYAILHCCHWFNRSSLVLIKKFLFVFGICFICHSSP